MKKKFDGRKHFFFGLNVFNRPKKSDKCRVDTKRRKIKRY